MSRDLVTRLEWLEVRWYYDTARQRCADAVNARAIDLLDDWERSDLGYPPRRSRP